MDYSLWRPTQMTPWQCFKADRARYGRKAWVAERSIWAIAVFRAGQAILAAPQPFQWLLRPPHQAMVILSELLTNIEIGKRAQIGPGFRIHHTGPVVINPDVTIGANCTLRVGNILGNRNDLKCPTLGDRVTVGAGAQILGGITVGDDVTIGAMSLVIEDVAANTTVAGVPARVIQQRSGD